MLMNVLVSLFDQIECSMSISTFFSNSQTDAINSRSNLKKTGSIDAISFKMIPDLFH